MPRSRSERPSLTAAEFTFVRQLLLEHAGILLEAGKEYLAESRLAVLAETEGYRSISALLEAAQRDGRSGDLSRRVIEAMTINETSFFRDLHPFEALRKHVLPELIEARAARRTLTIWFAAASSGQEPYSVAMMLREHFPQLHGWKVRLVASDLSEAMLARARAGTYNQMEINRGLPAPLLVKYFRKSEVEWRVRDDLRAMIEFHRINLTGPWPGWLPMMDLVMMRNVLIYFDLATRRSILSQIQRLLRPDGVLFLGSGETTLHLTDCYKPFPYGRAIGYRLAPKTGPSHGAVSAPLSTGG